MLAVLFSGEAWRLCCTDAEPYRPAVGVKTIKGSTPPKGRSVGSAEINGLVADCLPDLSPAGIRDAAIVELLYAAGLRRNDVIAPNLADYD